MFKRDKPLFSRPVLAIIIVASTLAIWLLNLTAPKANLATPSLESWQTDSGIPVTWLTQDSWQGSDKLTIAMVFAGNTQDSHLAAATLGMLTGPSLPLSTATINQRLSVLAAKAESSYTLQQQTLRLTLSSQPQYLAPTLTLLDAWLNQTQFKTTALQRWQRQQQPDLAQQQLLLQLLSRNDAPFVTPAQPITLDQLNQYLEHLKQHVSHIVITGALSSSSLEQVREGLNQLTQSMHHATYDDNLSVATTPSTTEIGQGELQSLYGAVALQPLTNVEDWLALQIWARDMLQWQKLNLGSQVAQWQLHLAPVAPYAQWTVQMPPVVHSDDQASDVATSWHNFSDLPSYQDTARFKELKQALQAQLENLSQNPSWWALVGSRIVFPNSTLTLEDFAQHYSEAFNSFTIEHYRQRLDALILPASRQEVQFKP